MFRTIAIVVGSLLVVGLVGMTVISRSESVQAMLVARGAAAGMAGALEITPGLNVFMCGTASPLGSSRDRAQACIAVITPRHFVVFDSGTGSPGRMMEARLPLNRLEAVFLTHFHSDHITGLPDLNLNSWVTGRQSPLVVIGPAGVEKVVNGFNDAFELDRGYRTAHHGESFLPIALGKLDSQVMNAGEVWSSDGLTVTSFEVDHSPISPAVGYRIDFEGRSVVISGDTVITPSLVEAAKGADLLFQDALNRQVLTVLAKTAQDNQLPRIAKIMGDIVDYHADASGLEQMAAEAEVNQLVLYHMIPNPDNFVMQQMFKHAFSRTTLMSEDKLVFRLPPGTDQIVVDRSAL